MQGNSYSYPNNNNIRRNRASPQLTQKSSQQVNDVFDEIATQYTTQQRKSLYTLIEYAMYE